MNNRNPRAGIEKRKIAWSQKSIPDYRLIPTRQDLVYAYLACLFPIQVWSFYNVLREVPAWLLQMNIWDLIGVISYTQMFVLLESIIIFLSLILLSIILPAGWFRNKFVALSTGVVFLPACWFFLAHVNDLILLDWGFRQFLPWVTLFFLSQFLVFLLIHYSQKVESVIILFVDRVMVLSFVYLLLDLASVLIIVIRNV